MLLRILIGIFFLPSLSYAVCGSFPVASSSDRVLSFLPESGVFKDFAADPAKSKNEGSIVYNSTTGVLSLCDGTNWTTITNIPSNTPANYAAAWGANPNGLLGNLEQSGSNSTPARLNSFDLSTTKWKHVDTGTAHSCGLRDDGKIFCWGYGNNGQLGYGSNGMNMLLPIALSTTGGWNNQIWSQLSVGMRHTCAIRLVDGQLFCWGYNYRGELGDGSTSQRNAPVPLSSTDGWNAYSWKYVSAGSNQTCAIRSDNQLFCWGNNAHGQLGDGTTNNSNVPVAVSSTSGGVDSWIQVTVGSNQTCAIRSDGRLFCWGLNTSHQLGDGTATTSSIPVAVTSPSGGVDLWKHVSNRSADHACAIRSDDKLFCWGMGSYGRLGNGGSSNLSVPTAVSPSPDGGSSWKKVDVQEYSACAIAMDDKMFCWGHNGYGQLGKGDTSDAVVPASLQAAGGWDTQLWKQVAAGIHACALRSDDRIFCWGNNSAGELGTGSTSNSSFPVNLQNTSGWSSQSWKKISSSVTHSCGIRYDGRLACWGSNAYGNFGDGTTQDSSIPRVVGSQTWKQVTATSQIFTCAIRSDDQLFCTGRNTSSQLGNGGTTQSASFVPVNSPSGGTDLWKQVSIGYLHACAIRSDDRLFCWGSGSLVGDGGSANKSTPTPVTSPSGGTDLWKQVSAGNSHTCAIRTDNKLFCWGTNSNGQLGAGDTVDSLVPKELSSTGAWNEQTWKQVSAGSYHNCAIRMDDKIFCWGTGLPKVPTALSSSGGWNEQTWQQVSAGESSTCAIKLSDGQLLCWGTNANGTLGSGNTTNSVTPVALSSTGGWNTKSWKLVQVAGTTAFAIEADPSFCDYFPPSSVGSSDLVIGFAATSGKLNMAGRSKFSAPQNGFMAYNRSQKNLMICDGERWKSLTMAKGNSCSSYPATTSRVIEWLADGSNLTFLSTQTKRTTPREGSLIYDPAEKKLQVCDGTNWQVLGGPDPCDSANPPVGTVCGGVVHAGTFKGEKYMIMPSGCDGTVTNPICSGDDSSPVWKPWNDGTANNIDVVGVENITGVAGKSTALGDANTDVLASSVVPNSNGSYKAAAYCQDMVYGGYSDWYLPAKSELAYIYCKSVAPGHTTNNPREDANCATYGGKENILKGFSGSYWSANEYSTSAAWNLEFYDGTASYTNKNSKNYYSVRCVRRF
ncbi:Regulator of chromosome condensation (RCC1) repeat protein [compost metagenome]